MHITTSAPGRNDQCGNAEAQADRSGSYACFIAIVSLHFIGPVCKFEPVIHIETRFPCLGISVFGRYKRRVVMADNIFLIIIVDKLGVYSIYRIYITDVHIYLLLP